jgi:hypothetical protein
VGECGVGDQLELADRLRDRDGLAARGALAEPFGCLPLGAPMGRHVHALKHEVERAPMWIARQGQAHDHAHALAIRAHELPLFLELVAGSVQQRAHARAVAFPLLRRDDAVESLSEQRCPVVAQERAERSVDLQQATVERDEGLADRGIGERGTEALLARLERGRLSVQVDEHGDLGAEDHRVVRLEDVVDGAGSVAAEDMVSFLADGRDEDDRDAPGAFPLPDQLGGLEAVHVGHLHVQEDQRELLVEEMPQSLLARPCHDEVQVERGQHSLERDEVLALVIDEQDARPARLHQAALRSPPHSCVR